MAHVGDIDALVFTAHALRQMFARSITLEAVRTTVYEGETIARYPTDQPYPSRLLLGWTEGRPLHVVMAHDPASRRGYVVTAYVPDATHWTDDFKTRRFS